MCSGNIEILWRIVEKLKICLAGSPPSTELGSSLAGVARGVTCPWRRQIGFPLPPRARNPPPGPLTSLCKRRSGLPGLGRTSKPLLRAHHSPCRPCPVPPPVGCGGRRDRERPQSPTTRARAAPTLPRGLGAARAHMSQSADARWVLPWDWRSHGHQLRRRQCGSSHLPAKGWSPQRGGCCGCCCLILLFCGRCCCSCCCSCCCVVVVVAVVVVVVFFCCCSWIFLGYLKPRKAELEL